MSMLEVSAAEQAFTRLTREQREALLREVFDALEYDEEGNPGGEWSSDTTQALGDIFGRYGVTFTPPVNRDHDGS